jgi:hypothetical protein
VVKLKGGTKPKGRFLDSACTEHTSKPVGGFEWKRPLAGTAVSFSSGGGTVFETPSGRTIACSGETSGSGDLSATSPQALLNVELTFRGCIDSLSGATCQGQNSVIPGELTTNQLRGELGYISGQGSAEPAVGLVLWAVRTTPRPKHPSFMSTAACDVESNTGRILVQIGVAGSALVSTIGPVDVTTSTWTQLYSESSPGVQSLTKFELGGEVGFETAFTFQAGHRERTGISLELGAATTEPVEIRAVLN